MHNFVVSAYAPKFDDSKEALVLILEMKSPPFSIACKRRGHSNGYEAKISKPLPVQETLYWNRDFRTFICCAPLQQKQSNSRLETINSSKRTRGGEHDTSDPYTKRYEDNAIMDNINICEEFDAFLTSSMISTSNTTRFSSNNFLLASGDSRGGTDIMTNADQAMIETSTDDAAPNTSSREAVKLRSKNLLKTLFSK
jgi:hypothetical protein